MASRADLDPELTTIVRTGESTNGWDDIVLPDDQLATLRDICNHIRHRHTVFETWGFVRNPPLAEA